MLIIICSLHRFLATNSGWNGWNLIHRWLKDAIDQQSLCFTNELLDLLDKCPMQYERLKSNEIPRLVKTLSKNCNDQDIVRKAKELVLKWRDLIPDDTPPKRKKKKERRDSNAKKNCINNSNVEDTTISERENTSSNDATNQSQPPSSPIANTENEDQIANRPRTAKVKLGKSRSALLSSDLAPPCKKKRVDGKKGDKSKGDSNTNPKTPIGPSRGDKQATDQTVTGSVTPSDEALSKSTPSSNLNSQSTSANKSQHTLKESLGFMEDITSVSTNIPRRKKKSDSKLTKQSSRDSDSSVDQSKTPSPINDDEEVASDDATDENSNSNFELPNIDTSVPPKEIVFEPKSILTNRTLANAGPAGDKPKKGVRWQVDGKIQQIRYFELDASERTNVSKNVGDKRQSVDFTQREGMQLKSATQKAQAKVNENVDSLMEWRCIKIDLPEGLPLAVPGSKSEEKRIRLPPLDLPHSGDPPLITEPVVIEKPSSFDPKTIPLEDNNNAVPDIAKPASIPQARPNDFYHCPPGNISHAPIIPNHADIRPGPSPMVQYQTNYSRPPYQPNAIPHDRPPMATYIPPNYSSPTVPSYGNPNLIPRQPGMSWSSSGPMTGSRPQPRMRPSYPPRGPPTQRSDQFYQSYHPHQPLSEPPNRPPPNSNHLHGHV